MVVETLLSRMHYISQTFARRYISFTAAKVSVLSRLLSIRQKLQLILNFLQIAPYLLLMVFPNSSLLLSQAQSERVLLNL